MEERFYFDLTFFKRFLSVLRVIFPRCCSITVLLFFVLLLLLLLKQVVVYYVGLVPSQYYVTLGDKDVNAYMQHTIYALVLVVSIAFIYATESYVTSVFYVTSRKVLTRYLHKSYFQDIFYYQINVLDDTLDNPDQRITQDVDKLCKTFSDITAKLLISPFTMAYYIYDTWTSTGYVGPLCVFAFFVISTVLNKFLMSPVVSLVYKQEQQEGNFRFQHMHIRTHSESAAFFRSGHLERQKSNFKLERLIRTQNKLILKEYLLNFFIKLADYIGSILSYVILAIPIFTGKYDDLSPSELSALISKNAFVTIYLIFTFTSLIDLAVKVTDLAGVTHRVAQMIEQLQEWKGKDSHLHDIVYEGFDSLAYQSSNDSSSGGVVAYRVKSVTFSPPNCRDQVLAKDLSFEVVPKKNLLITGDSGCGKSSLLRVMDGLWPCLSGHIERHVVHGHKGVVYLPQKPIMTDGSLREQIMYPYIDGTMAGIEDSEIVEFLRLVDLMTIYDRIGGLDVQPDWNWYDVMSPGEMQRLSFVRLFYHHPPFAVLDEATSQISEDMECTLYHQCRHLEITVVSVGHRESLRNYHDMELHLTGNQGQYTIQTLRSETCIDTLSTDSTIVYIDADEGTNTSYL